MPAVADMAMGTAPIAGGLAVGIAAGYLKGPDVRKGIKQDLELLDALPSEEEELRAELRQSINSRIKDLVAAANRYQPLRRAAASYRAGLRDILLLVCSILFTGVWWSVDHHKSSWMPMLVVLILISLWAATYALSGLREIVRSLRKTRSRRAAGS